MRAAVLSAICAVVLGMPAESVAIGPIPSPCRAGTSCATVTLDLSRGEDAGNWSPGSGRLTSAPAGLDCTANRGVQSGVCEYTFSWPASGSNTLSVVLTATADSKSWVDHEMVLGETYKYPITLRDGEPRFFSHIIFNRARWHVEVTKTGTGTGRVSGPNGIDCGSVCKTIGSVDVDKKITLKAAPDAGAVFKAWTGACSGQGATCTLTVLRETFTNAVFDLKPQTTTTTSTTTTADRRVDASVIAARAGKSRLGARIVEVEFAGDEDLAVTLTLYRKGKTLALKRFARVKEGRRVLTLTLPKPLKRGPATLGITASDAAGNRRAWTRSVRVPSRVTGRKTLARMTAALDPCSSANCATLAVAAGGKGSGRITSEPAGIDCVVTASVSSGTCNYRFLWPTSGGDLSVTLRLKPATGSTGLSPGGPYESASVAYHLHPGSTTLFNYTMFVLRKLQVSVTKSGVGTGRVIGTPGSIDCGSTCKTTVEYGTKVAFTAKPDTGALFKAWTGPCSGQDATCTLTVKEALSTNAVFELKPPNTTTTTTTTTTHDDDGRRYQCRRFAGHCPCRQEPSGRAHRRGRARRRRRPHRRAHDRTHGQDDRAQTLRPRQGRTARTHPRPAEEAQAGAGKARDHRERRRRESTGLEAKRPRAQREHAPQEVSRRAHDPARGRHAHRGTDPLPCADHRCRPHLGRLDDERFPLRWCKPDRPQACREDRAATGRPLFRHLRRTRVRRPPTGQEAEPDHLRDTQPRLHGRSRLAHRLHGGTGRLAVEPPGRAVERGRLAKRLERSADLCAEELRLFPGGEVPALVDLVEVGDVGVRLLDPAARGLPDLAGERGEAHG